MDPFIHVREEDFTLGSSDKDPFEYKNCCDTSQHVDINGLPTWNE